MAPEKEIIKNPVTEVVRTVIVQPISLIQFEERLTHRNPGKIELCQSWWIIKNQGAQNPNTIMTAGGKISDVDERFADNLAIEKVIQMDPLSHQSATIKIAACREAQDEIHLQGMPWDQVTELTRKPRIYSFKHSGRGMVTNQEHWVGMRVPNDFKPYAFYEAEDKIDSVVSLGTSRVEDMFSSNFLFYKRKRFPLVDNLIDDPSLRTDPIDCNSGEILNTRQTILEYLRNTEIALKYSLASEIRQQSQYGHAPNLEKYYNQLSIKFNNWDQFNESYQQFMRIFEENIPYPPRHMAERKTILQKEILQAWHRVLFKGSVHHFAGIRIQGDLLAARLPLEEATTDELEELEINGPELFRKMILFIQRSLTVKHYPDLSVPPDTAEERYRRLELYRKLKLNQSRGLSDDELILLRIWHQNFYESLEEIFGISQFQFAKYSSDHNVYFENIALNVAPQVTAFENIPTKLARSPFSTVTQLDELILEAHGYNPYVELKRGKGISHKAIFDSRLKLASIPSWHETNKYYYSSIGKSTYFWRQTLYDLFANKIANHNDHLEQAEELGEDYTIFYDDKSKKTLVVPSEESMGKGISVSRINTGLSLDNVPIYILENTRDKSLYSLKRKGDERGWDPSKIQDVYGTAIAIDTSSQEMKAGLEHAFSEYQRNTVLTLHQPITYKQWVENWGKRVILELLAPTIKEHARSLGYIYGELERKDKLDSQSPTSGSAASLGGFHELKYYAIMLPKHDLVDSHKDEQKIEVTFYPTVDDYYRKYTDDNEYALRRFEMVTPGSGRYSLWALYYWDEVYAVYSDIAGRRARMMENPKPSVIKNKIAAFLERVFKAIPPIIVYQR